LTFFKLLLDEIHSLNQVKLNISLRSQSLAKIKIGALKAKEE